MATAQAAVQSHAMNEVAAPAEPAEGAGASRRGPMRPDSLTPVRTRLSGALLGRLLRGLDVATLVLLAIVPALRAGPPLSAPFMDSLLVGAIAGLTAFALLRTIGGYTYPVKESLGANLVRPAVAVAGGGAAGAAAAFGWPALWPPLAGWASSAILALALIHLGALFCVRRWRAKGRLTPNVLVVGATDNAERLIQAAIDSGEIAVLGVFDDRSERIASSVLGVPVLGDTHALLGHRILPYVDRIVLTVNAAGPARTAELIERLRVLPNDLCLLLDDADPLDRSSTLSWLARSTFSLTGPGERESRRLSKRAQDVALGALLLLLALPVMALVALAVRFDSPGPVLFRQRRHGFNNEEIVVWKFRSMRTDLADHAGARQVELNDSRVTRVGRFIRRTSIDELPQILNVLGGQMSLVGPRPHPIGMRTAGEDSARLVSEYAWRHRMKPGITGWAQINGSRGPVHTAADVRRRVELDVDYIERQSFWFDLYIMLMTLPRLLGDAHTVR